MFITHYKNKLNTYLYQDGSLDGGASVIHVPEYLKIADIGNLPVGA